MKYHKLNITQEDIDKGRKRNPSLSCVISQAIKRSGFLNEEEIVCTSPDHINIYQRYKRFSIRKYELSPEGKLLVREFDKGLIVDPQTIELKEIEV